MRLLFIATILIILGGTFLYFYKNNTLVKEVPKTTTPPLTETDNVEIKATFKIITNGTVRVFTDSKYHNLSEEVYINLDNPNLIYVKKENINWSDFFKTLPMNLDKSCLVTGTKQTFCTGNGKYLKFFINGTEDSNVLDKKIKDNDKLLITFE